MSDYTKSTNFATKDNLSSGNPLKIVKGTEIDTEFNNIQTAIATKADLASTTFTGTTTIATLSVSGTSALTGVATLTANPILSAGTANGVTYLNGSKAVTSGSTFVFDGTNVGIGTSSPVGKLDVQGGRSYFASNSNAFAAYLRYNNSTNGVYLGSPSADAFQISSSAESAYLNINSSGNTTLAGTLTTSSRGIAKASMPAGSVLQVVSTTKNDIFSSSSTSFIDITGLSVSITPTSSTSKILVLVSSNYGTGAGSQLFMANLVRGSTNIATPNNTGLTYSATAVAYQTTTDQVANYSINFLDSPATTSSTTYKVQAKTVGGTFYVNGRNSADLNSVSTITVMEIAA